MDEYVGGWVGGWVERTDFQGGGVGAKYGGGLDHLAEFLVEGDFDFLFWGGGEVGGWTDCELLDVGGWVDE